MLFFILWIVVLAFWSYYLWKSPRVRGSLTILWRARKLRRFFFISMLIVTAITATFLLHPAPQEQDSDDRLIFENYAAQTVRKLDTLKAFAIDSACDLSRPTPELAYVLPLVLGSYRQIVEKPTLPVLMRLDDTLQFSLKGYKQFKNRGIRLNKLLQKKLGNRYSTKITKEGSSHTLQITYNGNLWDNEQLMALPVMEASHIYHLDPALYMSLIRHVSNFNFNYQGQQDRSGLLALEQGEGLEQIFLGAERLSKMLQVGISQENAIASFYPEPAIGTKPENWQQSPLTKGWVDHIFSDMEFYRTNGLAPFEQNN